MKVTAIILTYNEEVHLERCIQSILPLTTEILVVDSYSTDRTVEIAKKYKAKVIQKVWQNNHSLQFNWAQTQLEHSKTEWVLRIDADEILTKDLINKIKLQLSTIDPDINGVLFYRKIVFQGKSINFGGVGRNLVSRLFRYGHGISESRWMDEHIKIDGKCKTISAAIIDDNLNSVSWWIDKHNNYSSREAVDLLNLKYHFADLNSVSDAPARSVISKKRWVKEKIYSKLPLGLRALGYFLYRYIVLGGFMDGVIGSQFHFLQAFWYRYLVDIKYAEVERYINKHKVSPEHAINKVLGIKIN